MRRSPEIVILTILLLASMAAVLWYVHDRRAQMRAAAVPMHAVPTAPANSTHPPGKSHSMVDLTDADGKTIDFSSGQPVVKKSAADQAGLEPEKEKAAPAKP